MCVSEESNQSEAPSGRDMPPKNLKCIVRQRVDHCLSRFLRTAPALASAGTGTGVKVGRASEMGFISRCPPTEPVPPAFNRGTAAERGARKRFESV